MGSQAWTCVSILLLVSCASWAVAQDAAPAIVYAPERTFGQWVRDLPKDPTILVGFIISLLSGVGFLFVIWTVLFELVMGLPFKRQSFALGGSPSANGNTVTNQ